MRALSKAHSLSAAAIQTLREAHPKARTHLSVSEKGRIVLIPLVDILYLKAELKYVTIRTVTREFLLEESLSRLEEEFGEHFLRIHRRIHVPGVAIRYFRRQHSQSVEVEAAVRVVQHRHRTYIAHRHSPRVAERQGQIHECRTDVAPELQNQRARCTTHHVMVLRSLV